MATSGTGRRRWRLLSDVETDAGHLLLAREYAAELVELGEQQDDRSNRMYGLFQGATVLALLGEPGRGRSAGARRSGARPFAGARPMAGVGRSRARPCRTRARRPCRGAGVLRAFRAALRRGRLDRPDLQASPDGARGVGRARPSRHGRRPDRRVRAALPAGDPRAPSGADRPIPRADRLAPRRARGRRSGVRPVARAAGAGAEPVRARAHADGARDGAPAAPTAWRRAAGARGGGRALRALRRRRLGRPGARRHRRAGAATRVPPTS